MLRPRSQPGAAKSIRNEPAVENVLPHGKQWYAQAVLKAMLIPALLLVDLFKRKTEGEQRFLIWLFFLVFGITFVMGGDAIRHQARVEFHFSIMTFGQFLEDIWRMLTFRTAQYGARDVYNHVISYLFGRILGVPELYMPFVSAFYGYFFAGSVVLVLRHLKLSRLNYVLVALILLFLFIQGLQGVQTVRTWTGMWVLVYACLKYYETRRLGYLLLMFTPPLFHFGYWLMAIPAWIVLVYGSRPLLYTSLLAVSSFTAFIPAQPVTSLVERTERGADSLTWYQREEQIDRLAAFETRLGETNWYNAYRRAGLQRWAPTILVLTVFLSGLYNRGMSPYQRRIFSVGVLTLAFSNLTWFIWAVHNRTLIIASIFILAGFLMARLDPSTSANFRRLPPYYQWGLHLSLLFWFPLFLFVVSVTFDRLSLFAFFAPFLVVIEPGLNMSMKEALNLLLRRGG